MLQEHTYEPLGDTRTRRADVRVVCATNADLGEMLREGTFREDLYYRINLITVTLPPLRERPDDIPLLVEHLLRKVSSAAGREIPDVTPEAMELLKQQPWPGNIRQLANIVERTLLVTPGNTLDARDFQSQGLSPNAEPMKGPGRLKSAEKTEIENAITESGGNLTRAASLLGITRQTLYRRMAKYNIKSN